METIYTAGPTQRRRDARDLTRAVATTGDCYAFTPTAGRDSDLAHVDCSQFVQARWKRAWNIPAITALVLIAPVRRSNGDETMKATRELLKAAQRPQRGRCDAGAVTPSVRAASRTHSSAPQRMIVRGTTSRTSALRSPAEMGRTGRAS